MTNYLGLQFGNYVLTQLLGQGGFADVYLGRHIYLQRQMAIKVLQTQLTQKIRDEFLKEARINSQLLHPNIIRVHDFGIEAKNNIPFLVMDYAPNGTLRYPEDTMLEPANILPFVKQIAAALQCVHNAGLVHRDIKPENFLLSHNNEVLLSDFGIAVTAQNLSKHNVVGTLGYMAPEQIRGMPCAASDQYSFAVVIYEWLCGVCPFKGITGEIVQQHVAAAPPSISGKIPTIPVGVENVLFKALAKDPRQRFHHVQDFAAAFERACQTVSTTGNGLSISPTNSGSPLYTKKLLPTIVPIPTTKVLSPTKVLPTTPIVIAPTPGTSLYTYRCHSNLIYTLAWSPDSLRIASAGDDRTVQVWDAPTGNNVFVYRNHTRSVRSVMWSPDCKYIASVGTNQVAQVWEATSGKNLVTYRKHTSSSMGLSCSVAWSPTNGGRIASGSSDKTVQVWDAISGDELCIYRGHTAEVNAIAWSPDELFIASASDDMTVQVWNVMTCDNNFTYWNHTGRVRAISWSPDGKRIVSASDDTTVQVWDAFSGKAIFTYRNHDKRIRTVTWSPNGLYIASAGDGGTIHVWDATNGTVLFMCKGHTAGVNAIGWSSNGQYLASCSNDMTVQIWQAK